MTCTSVYKRVEDKGIMAKMANPLQHLGQMYQDWQPKSLCAEGDYVQHLSSARNVL